MNLLEFITEAVNPDVQAGIDRLVQYLQNQENENKATNFPNLTPSLYSTTPPGSKYTRVIRSDGVSRSVYCFVGNEDGQIWYPAGWAGPTLNFPRGNVLDPNSWSGFGVYGLIGRY